MEFEYSEIPAEAFQAGTTPKPTGLLKYLLKDNLFARPRLYQQWQGEFGKVWVAIQTEIEDD